MSSVLLGRLKAHLVDDGSQFAGYAVRYYRWTDADLNGSGGVVLFRNADSGGTIDHVTQHPDVMIQLLADPDSVTQADADMLSALRYLRENFSSADVFNYRPIGTYTGPVFLQNNRAHFEMTVRCGVEDH